MSEARKKMNYDSPFPTRLRTLLDETQTTQDKLAEFVGVKRQSIGQWKDGVTVPDILAFQKIAKFFNVTYEYLLGDSESKIRENIDISKKFNLSDIAIENLSEMSYFEYSKPSVIDTINLLLENENEWINPIENVYDEDGCVIGCEEVDIDYGLCLFAEITKYLSVKNSDVIYDILDDGTLAEKSKNIQRFNMHSVDSIRSNQIIENVLLMNIQDKLKQLKQKI